MTPRVITLLIAPALSLVAACTQPGADMTAATPETAAAPAPGFTATLRDSQGRDMGRMTLGGTDGAMSGAVRVSGLTPGPHGMHLHMVGQCAGPDFQSAGAHLNPDGKQHGMENPMGAHQGDLPDVVVAADGSGTASFTAQTRIAALMDADGSALVIHEKPDDGRTDPSGNSGARLLCGVIEPAR